MDNFIHFKLKMIHFLKIKYDLFKFLNDISYIFYAGRERIKYIVSKNKSLINIERLDSGTIPECRGEIRLFSVMRNEALRIPYFINYYRQMGVDRFFLVDNYSTDNSCFLVSDESDIHIFRTAENYQNHWNWMECILEKYGRDHWCLVVDLDELFAFPNSKELSLRQFSRFLEIENVTAVRSLLLDMYSDTPINKIIYRGGQNPLEVIPYFDREFKEISSIFFDRSRWKSFVYNTYIGGVRERVFGPNIPNHLSKVSFFKYQKGTYLTQGMHAINNAKSSNIHGVTFHTKFLSDLIDEVKEEIEREQHFGNAIVYKIFNRKIIENPNIRLDYQGSVKFQDSQQLIDLGMMKTTHEFEAYAAKIIAEKEKILPSPTTCNSIK